MKKVLLTIRFVQLQGRWDWSPIRNVVAEYNPKFESVHDAVKRVCDLNDMTLCFGGKPRGTLFEVDEKNQYHEYGFNYRGKCEMFDRGMKNPILLYWDVRVKINPLNDFSAKELMAA